MTMTNGHVTEVISPSELLLYGRKFKLASGQMQESLVSVFPGKIVQGDAQRVDDPLASSYVMSDWTGGLLKQEMIPAVDFDRFWLSTGATWYSRQLTLGPYVRYVKAPEQFDSVERNILAGIEYMGSMYFGWGEFLLKLMPDETLSVVYQYAGAGPPSITNMIVYRIMAGAGAGQSKLVFAHKYPVSLGGDTGYMVYNGTTVVPGVSGEDVVDFTIWDDKLVKLDPRGVLKTTLDLAAWTDLVGGVVTLPFDSASTLAIFPNGFGDDAIHIGTNEGLYFYDESASKVRRTKLILPRVKDQGTTMINHQDNLFFAGGSTQILRYTGATVDPNTGLNQDDGLPMAYRGRVVYLHSSLNFLVAVVDSAKDPSPLGDPIYTGDELGMATTFMGSTGFAFFAGQTHIGGGWHILARSEIAGASARWAGTSSANDRYRGYFGIGGMLGIMDLHSDILNVLQNPIQEFRSYFEHITPWNDHGWSELDKLALVQEFGVLGMDRECECRIVVSYAINREGAWYPLVTLDSNHPTKVRYGADGLGVSYKSIRFRFEGFRCPNLKHTPVMKFSTLVFLKQLPPRYGYRMDLDCTLRYAGLEPEEQVAFLKTLADPEGAGALMGEMVAWVDGVFTKKAVKVVTLTNAVGSGPETRGMVKISVVEPVEPVVLGA